MNDKEVLEEKIDSQSILCNEVKKCVEKGYISVDDDIEFRTIRDASDLFKNIINFIEKIVFL